MHVGCTTEDVDLVEMEAVAAEVHRLHEHQLYAAELAGGISAAATATFIGTSNQAFGPADFMPSELKRRQIDDCIVANEQTWSEMGAALGTSSSEGDDGTQPG